MWGIKYLILLLAALYCQYLSVKGLLAVCDNPTTFLLVFQQVFFPEAGTLLLP